MNSDNQVQSFRALEEDRQYRLTRLVCWIVCVGFALIEAWTQRRFINEDGISYLDMSDVLIRHNWQLLVNPIWSPLYPFFIGVVTWLARPAAQWEAPMVHALNFLIFLGALASFEFLLQQVISLLRRENAGEAAESAEPDPVWVWQVVGYSAFAWSTVGMIWAPRMITPDLCVAMFVYLDAGLLLRLRTSANRSAVCLLLGLTLGLGYLAKAILFPMAFLFMVLAFLVIGQWRKALRPVAVTFLLFCAIAAPLVISMSVRVGRPSYSEAGNMNYVWHVNGFDPYFSSASGPPAFLKHPMAILHRGPEVYAFREPIAYTYPPRQDMEYWSAGTPARISREKQLRAVGENLKVLFTDVHIIPMWGLIGGGLILSLVSPNPFRRFRNILGSWPLLIPGVVGPLLYLLVSVEPRYVAPFLLLVFLGSFPGIFLRSQKDSTRRTVLATLALAASVTVFAGLLVVYHVAGFPRQDTGDLWVQVGKSLNAVGVQPGENVAIIGDSSDGCRWARMARVRIVAQVLREDVPSFWRLAPSVQSDVYEAFVKAGAKAVVAEKTTPSGGVADWQRLGNTDYFVHFLDQSSGR
jgi:hypothetical protein